MPVSKCSGCDEVFTGMAPFDAHQKETNKHPYTVCKSPADAGLTQNDRGQWGTGGNPEVAKAAYVRADDRPDSDFEIDCAKCGTVFLRPRGRGRPPKKCPDCRGVA